MGIFYETIEIINRSPIDLLVTFDGQRKRLKPGSNQIPEVCLVHALNQNPIMGSQDPYNPHVSGGRYLIGVPGSESYPCEPLTQQEWEEHLQRPCREDEQVWFMDRYGSDPKARQVLMGKGRKSTATSRVDAGSSPGGSAEFSNKER